MNVDSEFDALTGNDPSNVAMHNSEQSQEMASSGPAEDDAGVSILSMPRTPNSSLPEKAAKPGSGGKGKKKRKTPMDVNAPKKPVSAYITYLNERRETVKSENPSMTYPDILKKLAAEWSGMSTDDRKKYHDEANK